MMEGVEEERVTERQKGTNKCSNDCRLLSNYFNIIKHLHMLVAVVVVVVVVVAIIYILFNVPLD